MQTVIFSCLIRLILSPSMETGNEGGYELPSKCF